MFEMKDRNSTNQPRMELSIADEMRPRFNKLRDCATMYRNSPTSPKFVTIKYDKKTYTDFEVWTKGKYEDDSQYKKHEVTKDEGIALPHIWSIDVRKRKMKAADKKDSKAAKGKRKRGEASGLTPESKVTKIHEILLENESNDVTADDHELSNDEEIDVLGSVAEGRPDFFCDGCRQERSEYFDCFRSA